MQFRTEQVPCYGLGSVTTVVDSDGQVVDSITYDSFGQIVAETNAAVDFLFGYTGRDIDRESDLYFYRARYYDPGVGRFASRDPIGFAGGDANLYRYVANEPTGKTDPSGLQQGCGAFGWIGYTQNAHNPGTEADRRKWEARAAETAFAVTLSGGGEGIVELVVDKATGGWWPFGIPSPDDLIDVPLRKGARKAVECAPRGLTRPFTQLVDDIDANPSKWKAISAHTEKTTRKGARRHGASTQTIYRNTETGETIVRHTVTDDLGRVVDDHWRPNYKPRVGDVFDGQ